MEVKGQPRCPREESTPGQGSHISPTNLGAPPGRFRRAHGLAHRRCRKDGLPTGAGCASGRVVDSPQDEGGPSWRPADVSAPALALSAMCSPRAAEKGQGGAASPGARSLIPTGQVQLGLSA